MELEDVSLNSGLDIHFQFLEVEEKLGKEKDKSILRVRDWGNFVTNRLELLQN